MLSTALGSSALHQLCTDAQTPACRLVAPAITFLYAGHAEPNVGLAYISHACMCLQQDFSLYLDGSCINMVINACWMQRCNFDNLTQLDA